ncbi:methionine ABC transporter ATP-binding protein, partial [Rhizobium ruizarguesonis]
MCKEKHMNSFVSTTAIAAEPQTATEEVVRLTDVKRRFGTTAALDGISLTVK